MRLDRNVHPTGKGKYSVIDNRTGKIVEESGPGERNEFFVVFLKDFHSLPAIAAYAASAVHVDEEYATEVRNLCARAGKDSPFCKQPD